MRVRWILGAVVAAIALGTVAPPAEAANCKPDWWTGGWAVGSSHKEDGQTVIEEYGWINLRFSDPDTLTDLTGTYLFSGGGILIVTLDDECSQGFTGSYRDQTGEGKVKAKFVGSTRNTRFSGKYWPCLTICSSRPWWGRKVS
jgi:hypothetical protein